MTDIKDFRKENVLSTEEIISQIFDNDNDRVIDWLNANFDKEAHFTRNHQSFGQVYGDIWDGIEIQVGVYLENIKNSGDVVNTLSDEELDELCTLLTDEIYTYHEQPKLTLKQALEQTGRAEFDISDTVFDSFCVAFVYDTGAKELLGEDDYNKVLGWMAENIEVKSFDDGTAECKVSDFIEKNYELFKNFCNEHNNDYYQMDRKDIDTNIEIALATVKSLIVGGYGDKAYSELANEIDKDKNEPSHEDEER